MRIAIDLTPLLDEHTGVDNYLVRLVRALASLDLDDQYTIFINREDAPLFEGSLPPSFDLVRASVRSRLARLAFEQIGLPIATARARFDVVHSPSYFMPLYRGGTRHLLTVYDVTFFSLPQYHTALRRSWPFRSLLAWSIRHADLVTVPSCSTRDAIRQLLPDVAPERLVVIRAGVGEEFQPRPPEQARALAQRLGLRRPYLLHVGTLEPRKNLVQLVRSYQALMAGDDIDADLVLAGRPGWSYQPLQAAIDTPALRERVHLIGYVPARDLPILYAGAEAFVYPSLHEGFGFPPLEAMSCGVPTIASDNSALVENLEGAALLVSPTDGAAITAAMRRVLRDEPLRAELRQRGLDRSAEFRWRETARQTRACYGALARVPASLQTFRARSDASGALTDESEADIVTDRTPSSARSSGCRG